MATFCFGRGTNGSRGAWRRYVFSVGKHARLCGSPYENKRPPNGGLLFWQGHKGSNSGHAVLETAALPTELYPYRCRFDSAVRACSEPSHAGAGDGNRTRTASLEGWNSTIELHPQNQRLIIVSHGWVRVKRFLIFLPLFRRTFGAYGQCSSIRPQRGKDIGAQSGFRLRRKQAVGRRGER